MKRAFILLLVTVAASCLFSQTEVTPYVIQYSQDPNAPFRLYQTKNIYTYLKLDTRNGQLTQVQWSLKENEFETPLSYMSRVPIGEPDTIPGRFTLYATSNIYTFLLVDQKNGKVYHVQWNNDVNKRLVNRIY